jgi:ribosomal protein L33
MKKIVPTEKEIARQHGVSVKYVIRQAEIGSTIEREHVTTHEEAYGIALQHIMEFPDYYKHLLPMEKQLKSEWKKKDPIKENHIDIAMGHMLDDEGSMIINQLDEIERYVQMLRGVITGPEMQVPGWVQSKVTLATDYLNTSANYMSSKNEEVQLDKLSFKQFSEICEGAAWTKKSGKHQAAA